MSSVLTFFKRVSFISCFLLFVFPSKAQIITGIPSVLVSDGFVMPHHEYMNYLIKGHVVSANFEMLNRNGFFRDYKYWHLAYKHPFTGWGVYYANLGNPQQLGSVLAAYKKLQVPIKGSKRFYYQINGGVSYLTKVFDIDANYYNTVIGSHVNVFFKLGLIAQQTINHRFVLFFDLNFTHYSNGNYYEPNAGINVVSIGLGLRMSQPVDKCSSFENKIIDNDFLKYSTEIVASGGVKSLPYQLKKNFFMGSVMLNGIYRPNFKNGFDAGLDGFYDKSAKTAMTFMEIPGFQSSYYYRAGFHVGYEPQFGKTVIAIQMGVYFFDRLNDEGYFYHRVALKQYLTKRLLLSVAVKTHFFKAEFVEWGIGYRIFVDKPSGSQ